MITNSNTILLLGATGLLGKALTQKAKEKGYTITTLARSNADINIDITDDNKLIEAATSQHFDYIINSCAIVNHEQCETDKKLAYMVNSRPSAVLAELSKDFPFKYIYISTDGYFSNDDKKKHAEHETVSLLNEYARTKYLGEKFTELSPNSLIIRTNIIGFKKNPQTQTFLEWVIESLEEKKAMTLFDDYYTSSITVSQFSEIFFDLLSKNPHGILNIASSEVFSKKEFITALAKKLNFSLENTTTGSVKNLSASKRANSLGLDTSKAEKLLGYICPTLNDVISRIEKEYHNVQKRN